MEVTLSPQDSDWAWRLGLRYGAWHPEPRTDLAVLGKQWVEYADPHLNKVAAAFGNRLFNVPLEVDFTENQTQALLPYLRELSQWATYAFEVSIYYRRAMVDHGRADPRIAQPTDATIEAFAGEIDRFLDANPDLRVHLVARARADEDAPTPVQDSDEPLPDPPGPQPYGVSHVGAELLVAAWMRHLGALDAQPTKVSGDGGIDVISSRYIAQVKNLAAGTAVPIAAIRDLAGVAGVDGRKAAMFTSGAYSPGGREFADRAGIALFRYDAVRGQLISVNAHASRARADGMG